MLRMGRTPKPETTENEKPAAPQQYPVYNAPAPPAAPAQYAVPETPVRPEIERPSTSTTSTTTRAVTETESLAREIKDGTMSGFVGGGTVLSGEAVFKGMLRIDGHLTGRISSEKGTLIVSSGGRVDADIHVATAKINGTIKGDIIATERLELGRTAQVFGDIQTPVLLIEQGAIFEGGCRMSTIKAEVMQAKEQTEKPRAKEAAGRNNLPQHAPAKALSPEPLETSHAAS
jgi:cytoskeletal protein CcmA (bactofilin family)